MNLAVAVGKRTKELLFKNKMTQYRLCKITCLNEKTLRDLINGRTSDVNFSTIFLISSAFKMHIKEFVDSDLFNETNIEF